MSNRRLNQTDRAGQDGPVAPLRPVAFSTAGLPLAHQFDAYAARCAGVVEVEPVDDVASGFAFQNRVWALGGVALSCVETAAVRYARPSALVRRDPIDAWTVAVFRRGNGVHSAGGRDTLMTPGQLQIGTLASPFAGWRGASAWQMLFVARDRFPDLAERMDGANGAVPDGPLAGLLADFLLGLEPHLARAREADRPALAAAVGTMLAACLAPTAERLALAAAPIEATLAARARAIVRARLHQPQLGPRLLGRELGLSRSRLYRLFETEGGVARYIQRQRLLAARAALSDPATPETIGRVAERFGFADQSVFSRAYRAEFGVTPRETRQAARAGQGAAPGSLGLKMDDRAPLGALLRMM